MHVCLCVQEGKDMMCWPMQHTCAPLLWIEASWTVFCLVWDKMQGKADGLQLRWPPFIIIIIIIGLSFFSQSVDTKCSCIHGVAAGCASFLSHCRLLQVC